MLMTYNKVDERGRVSSISFQNTENIEGQLNTHTFSYLYQRILERVDLGIEHDLGDVSQADFYNVYLDIGIDRLKRTETANKMIRDRIEKRNLKLEGLVGDKSFLEYSTR